MDGETPAPETESNAAPSSEKNPVDEAWTKLYSSAEEMLRSYKKVLEFYSKWLSDIFPYFPLVSVYKTRGEWKALDTLDAMADQSEMLLTLGAEVSLLEAAEECRRGLIEEPTTLLAKRTFADNILLIAEKLVMDNPKKKYSVDDAPCRKNVKGSFTKLAEETHRCMKDALMRCDIFLRLTTAINDGTDSNEDGSSGDQTPKKQNGNAPINTEPKFHHPAESSVKSTIKTPQMSPAMQVTFDDSARAALARAIPSVAVKILADAEHRHSEDDKAPNVDLTESGNVTDNEDGSQVDDDQVNNAGFSTPRAPSPAYSCEDYPQTPGPKEPTWLHMVFDIPPSERQNGENEDGEEVNVLDWTVTYPRRLSLAEKRRRREIFAELERVNYLPDGAYEDDDDDEGGDEGGRRVR